MKTKIKLSKQIIQNTISDIKNEKNSENQMGRFFTIFCRYLIFDTARWGVLFIQLLLIAVVVAGYVAISFGSKIGSFFSIIPGFYKGFNFDFSFGYTYVLLIILAFISITVLLVITEAMLWAVEISSTDGKFELDRGNKGIESKNFSKLYRGLENLYSLRFKKIIPYNGFLDSPAEMDNKDIKYIKKEILRLNPKKNSENINPIYGLFFVKLGLFILNIIALGICVFFRLNVFAIVMTIVFMTLLRTFSCYTRQTAYKMIVIHLEEEQKKEEINLSMGYGFTLK